MTQNQQYWQFMLQKWAAKGLSQAEFCRQTNINRRHFCAWKSRLQPLTSAASGSPAFIEPSSGVSTGEPGPVVLPLCGMEIHYDQNTCPGLLVRLLKLLREEL